MKKLLLLALAPSMWAALLDIPSETPYLVTPGQTFFTFAVGQSELDSPPYVGLLNGRVKQSPTGYTVALYYTESAHVQETVFDAALNILPVAAEYIGPISYGLHIGEVVEAVLPRSPGSYTLRLEDGGASWITTARAFVDPPGLPAPTSNTPEPETWLLVALGLIALGMVRSRKHG